MSVETGTTLGPYAVTAKIGEGGMGEVWEATDTKLNSQVALKILPSLLSGREPPLSGLRHPPTSTGECHKPW